MAPAGKSTATSKSTALKEPADKSSNVLGKRLAAFRKKRMLTLEQVATTAEVTKSHLSKLERGISSPTIGTLLKLARALQVSAEQLIGDAGGTNEILVTKALDRVPLSASDEREGNTYEAMATQRTEKAMVPFIMHPPSAINAKKDLAGHPGEEFIFLISGKMEVVFEDRIIKLSAGDSVYFDASLPHRSRSMGKTPAKALVVVTTPMSRSLFSVA
jgi:transcriptional regulator with XRE-family HTH domain